MEKATLKDISNMAKQYKKLAKTLKLSLSDTLLLIASRELIIANKQLKSILDSEDIVLE